MSTEKDDRIAALFTGKTVFITGGTGFLGKVLIEKLLRCCSGVKRIYVLIRSKRGVHCSERLNAVFDNPLYDMLKKQDPKVIEKVMAVQGDISQEHLGISVENRKVLVEEIDFIFHSAATTRFDETLYDSVKINTRGTKYALDLAKECKHLKMFVLVSTASAHWDAEIILEKPYDPPHDPHEILKKLENGSLIESDLVGPNSYTYSKQLAEGLVNDEMKNLPVIIARPVLVGPVLGDPYPGWSNNLQGIGGLFVAAGKGVLRIVYLNKTNSVAVLPADITINGILLSVWDVLINKGGNIINLACPKDELDFTWEEAVERGKDVIRNKLPFNVFLWYPGGDMTMNLWEYYIKFYLFQFIPAIFVDILLFVFGQKPALVKAQLRIASAMELIRFLAMKNWKFETRRAKEVRFKTNEIEKKKYKIDTEGFVLETYLYNCIKSTKRIQLKESEKYDELMVTVMKGMYVLDKLCKTLFFVILFYYIRKWFLL